MTSENGYLYRVATTPIEKDAMEIVQAGLDEYNTKILDLINSFPSDDNMLVFFVMENITNIIEKSLNGLERAGVEMLREMTKTTGGTVKLKVPRKKEPDNDT